MKPYIPFALLAAGITEMTLKTISGFTDPEALQLTIDFLCLFLLGAATVGFAKHLPETGRRGKP